SLIIGLGVTIVSLLASVPAAFALAKLHIRGSASLSLLLAFVQLTPMVAVVTPLFLTFYRLGLLNTHLSVVLAVSTFTVPFATLVLVPHMQAVPSTLIEAAEIDGASLYRVFWSIVLPLVRPAVAAVALLVFLQGWGNFVFPVAFL